MIYPINTLFFCVKESLLRNINNNFYNISFKYCDGRLTIQFILTLKSEIEFELIDDIIAQLTSNIGEDIVELPVIILLKENWRPFENIIFSIQEIEGL